MGDQMIEWKILRYAHTLAGFQPKKAFQNALLFYILGQEGGRERTNEIRGSSITLFWKSGQDCTNWKSTHINFKSTYVDV